jgi:hypothetical protein
MLYNRTENPSHFEAASCHLEYVCIASQQNIFDIKKNILMMNGAMDVRTSKFH